jgi:ER-bound oxygenase mpaB/B'/Rubber oxygenase, catalytic domain
VPSDRWTDAYLDSIRALSDERADRALQAVLARGPKDKAALRRLFGAMDSNDDQPVSAVFEELREFFEQTRNLPSDVDLDRIRRGEAVFNRNAIDGAQALLCKSLPSGYQAPTLSIILNVSGNLVQHTYRRLLSTLQTVVNVSAMNGFQHGGRAVITAQKLRLMHAGVRHVASQHPELTSRPSPDGNGKDSFSQRYGIPINLEDMLATSVGFSLLVVRGWRILGNKLTAQEEEDYMYLWMTFARLMGIHPPGEPESRAFIPENLADAEVFYRQYERRHYVSAEQNPDGVVLARADLAMLERKLKKVIRPLLYRLGFGLLPRMRMQLLLGKATCRQLGLPIVRGHWFLSRLLLAVHPFLDAVEVRANQSGDRLGLLLLQDLICWDNDNQRVEFMIPEDLKDLKRMVFQPTLSDEGSPAQQQEAKT